MAYREFPWGGDGKTTSFVTHVEVKNYLSRYAKAMDIEDLISYKSTVTQLDIISEKEECEASSWPQIKLKWEESGRSDNKEKKTTHSEVFDAVCVCNGHYYRPTKSHTISGIENFEGKVYHSIQYDDPSIFKDQNVLCIGGRASGADLAREISHHANKVYLSDSTCPDLSEGQPFSEGNVLWVPRTTAVLPNSRISFGPTCNETPKVDVIILCIGYDYQFPFINEHSNLDFSAIPDEKRIKPLYEQLWHARYPSLSFIGLQHSIVPFPFYELQAEAVVEQLIRKHRKEGQKRLSLEVPQLHERMESAENDANSGGPNEPGRIRDTHYLGQFQWDEALKYAKFAGLYDENLKRYIMTNKAIYEHTGKQRKKLFPGGVDTYRYNSYVRDDENESFQFYSLL
mmetsp:Transcript_29942/g.33560  ORF Transcript_29942/g.33560 Transcript_29942/m.33560 type:complete len:399 (-) Transcript_29942:670-1866(-)